MIANEQEHLAKEGRFAFGENWRRFASELPRARIDSARDSLTELLGQDSLANCTFLDVGSGSGLFSLAAATLGAARVHSIDSDITSVTTTHTLKDRFAPTVDWSIDHASVLDEAYMRSLGPWDIVYSWGVLHHTGDMWNALARTCGCVRPSGRLVVAIYNDQGRASRRWKWIKRLYSRLPGPLRVPYVVLVMLPTELRTLASHMVRLQPGTYFRAWSAAGSYDRGMSRWHDLIDWVGGYPFEVATPEQVFEFCTARGFVLRKLVTVGGGYGCNQFVFELAHDSGTR